MSSGQESFSFDRVLRLYLTGAPDGTSVTFQLCRFFGLLPETSALDITHVPTSPHCKSDFFLESHR